MIASNDVRGGAARGVGALEPTWAGPGPRFLRVAAEPRTRCGGCGAPVPVGSPVVADRLEEAVYHPGCAWVAIESTPWLIPMFARLEPRPGQVIAHPAYGWLLCVRVAARVWADNGVGAATLIRVAARRALAAEVAHAQWRASQRMGDANDGAWLDRAQVGELVDATAAFTGWPVTRAAREPEHVVVTHPSGLHVVGQVAPAVDTEQWLAEGGDGGTTDRRTREPSTPRPRRGQARGGCLP